MQSSPVQNTALVSKQFISWLVECLYDWGVSVPSSKTGNLEHLENVMPVFFSMEEVDQKEVQEIGKQLTFFMLFVGGLICHYIVFFPQIVKLTIYRMLPKNLLRRTLMQRLHLFPEDVSGHTVGLAFFLLWRWRALAKLQSQDKWRKIKLLLKYVTKYTLHVDALYFTKLWYLKYACDCLLYYDFI